MSAGAQRNTFFNRVKKACYNLFHDRKELISEFGFSYWLMDTILDRLNLLSTQKHYVNVYHAVYRDVKSVIHKYKTADFPICEESYTKNPLVLEDKIPVWICWWQGAEQMPNLVKVCYESVKKQLPELCDIHLITWENVNDYIEFPDNIIMRYEDGAITMTHLSDVLRFLLVTKYGGFWIDATYFFAKPVSKEALCTNFFVRRRNSAVVQGTVSRGRWSGNYFIGKNGDFLYCFVRDCIFEYWEKHQKLIEYLLVDYLFWIAYEKYPKVRERIEKLPYTDSDHTLLMGMLNQEFNETVWNNLLSNNKVFKLTYKEVLKTKTEDNKITFWGYIKELYDEKTDNQI